MDGFRRFLPLLLPLAFIAIVWFVFAIDGEPGSRDFIATVQSQKLPSGQSLRAFLDEYCESPAHWQHYRMADGQHVVDLDATMKGGVSLHVKWLVAIVTENDVVTREVMCESAFVGGAAINPPDSFPGRIESLTVAAQ